VRASVSNAGLLQQAKGRWDGKVVARTSMHDLLFTLPNKAYPWHTTVEVSYAEGVFEFQLVRGLLLVTADRATEENAPLCSTRF
jgi:hypothetical protein